MPLAKSRDDRLVSLCVVVSLEARVFVVKSVKSLLQLLFFSSRRGMHGIDDARLGEFDCREPHRMLACRDRVVGVCVLQLRDAADVAGMQDGNLDPLLSLGN